jgi:UDP-glucose 4-epimerase
VSDLAEAHVLALRALERNAIPASCYNLGTGNGFSVREVIKAASVVTRQHISIREGPRRPGDPPRLVADPTRATTDLGWKPGYGDLTEIITTAWDWMQSRPAPEVT